MAKSDLTPKQQMFVDAYLIDLNATKAAIKAGYSEKTAQEQGSRLLLNVMVAASIQAAMDKRSAKFEVSADKVLSRLDAIGGVDIADAYTTNGALKNIHDIPAEVRKCIASIETLEKFEYIGGENVKIGDLVKVKFWDKIKSNELIGKHLKLFTDKIEHSVDKRMEDLIGGSFYKDEEEK